jgi:hypothetical protein
LDWACTVIGVLPTPQLRTVAFVAVLRDAVDRRSREGPGTMTVTVCLPATEVISIDAMASVDVRAGDAPCSLISRASPRCQARIVASVTAKASLQRRCGSSRQRGQPRPIGRHVPNPVNL